MRTKIVKRYYCDFCSKGSFKKPSAIEHEGSCTLNPKRGCGLCGCTERDYAALVKESISKSLSKESPVNGEDYFVMDSKESIGWLLSKVDGCPTCALSVLRQGKILAFDVFDYREELAGWHREQMEGIGF
jgi:hypothetical protein